MRSPVIRDLGEGLSYGEARQVQERLHLLRCRGAIPDTLLLLEHRKVYTLGCSADLSHLLRARGEVLREGIEVVEADRGGDITYHGPGQIIGYPIVHLGEAGLHVVEYVTALEEILIRTAADFGVRAGRDPRNRGVWVGNSKLAALGIRVSHRVTLHGFALNVSTDLSDFEAIIPCGLPGVGVTSLEVLLGRAPDRGEVKRALAAHFCEVLYAGTPGLDPPPFPVGFRG